MWATYFGLTLTSAALSAVQGVNTAGAELQEAF